MSRAARISRTIILACAVLAVLTAAAADDRGLVFRIDEPIAVGDQIYAGGEISLRHLQAANLVALRIDGVHVGILANTGWAAAPFGARPFLVCVRGADGLLRFKGVRFKSEIDARQLDISFEAVALNPGIAPVDPRLPEAQTRIATSR